MGSPYLGRGDASIRWLRSVLLHSEKKKQTRVCLAVIFLQFKGCGVLRIV